MKKSSIRLYPITIFMRQVIYYVDIKKKNIQKQYLVEFIISKTFRYRTPIFI